MVSAFKERNLTCLAIQTSLKLQAVLPLLVYNNLAEKKKIHILKKERSFYGVLKKA